LNSFLGNNHGKTNNEDVEIFCVAILYHKVANKREEYAHPRKANNDQSQDSPRMVDKDVEIVLGSIVACCMKNCMETTINGNVVSTVARCVYRASLSIASNTRDMSD
jgi:hypothetical protein